MQSIVNQPYIKRRKMMGKIGLAAGFVGLAVGVALMFQMTPGSDNTLVLIGAYAAVIVGLIALNIGTIRYQEWSRKPTPMQSIMGALKNTHKKNVLFSYLPHLPGQHLLLTPSGVFVLLTKHVEGTVSGSGEQWKHTPLSRWSVILNPLVRFSQAKLGNPVPEARAAETAARELVIQALGSEIAAQVPVQSIVVFTNIAVKVALDDPAVPGVVPNDLRGCLAQNSQGRLNPTQIDKLTTALKGDFEPEIEGKEKRHAPKKRAVARR